MAEEYRPMTDQERQDMDLEIRRIRAEELGFIFGGIPLNASHGERIAMRQQSGLVDPIARFRGQRQQASSGASSSFSHPQGPVPTAPRTTNAVALMPDDGYNDPCRQFVNMYSTAQDKWHPFPATLDTGTPDNWIDEATLEVLAVQPNLEVTEVEFMDFSGRTVKSRATVNVPWCAAGGSRKVRTHKFRVAESAPFDVILGSKLLLAEEGILVFNKTAWILAKKDPTEEEKLSMTRARAKAAEESKMLAEKKRNATSKSASKPKIEPTTLPATKARGQTGQ